MAKTASLSDLIAKKAALEKQIASFRREQRSQAIVKVKGLMAEYGLSVADIAGSKVPVAPARKSKRVNHAAGKKVAPKYRNPASGETWSGRGLKPKWLAAALKSGSALADFAL